MTVKELIAHLKTQNENDKITLSDHDEEYRPDLDLEFSMINCIPSDCKAERWKGISTVRFKIKDILTPEFKMEHPDSYKDLSKGVDVMKKNGVVPVYIDIDANSTSSHFYNHIYDGFSLKE